MNSNLMLVFSVILFAGLLAPAYAESTDHVVINEVDINPPGDDICCNNDIANNKKNNLHKH